MSKLATLIMGPRYPLIKKDQKKKIMKFNSQPTQS